MKKNKKNIVVFSISVASICFTSYKILKKVKPKKIELLKNNLKDIVSNDNDKNKKEEIKSPVLKEKKCYNNKAIKPVSKNDKIKDDNKPLDSAISNNNILDNYNTLYIKTSKKDIQKHLDQLIVENEKSIEMPDNYIEDEIRYQLCLTNKEPITKNILERLTRIDFFEIDDKDIEIYCDFLCKYTNIKSIVIDNLNPLKYDDDIQIKSSKYSLKNISPINKLTSLEELSFNWGIENIDFSVLYNLQNLKKLEIKFGILSNIDFISNLQNLESLEIMLNTNIKDFSPIKNLPKLKSLYIYTNSVIDTTIFKEMKSLQKMYLNGESIILK